MDILILASLAKTGSSVWVRRDASGGAGFSVTTAAFGKETETGAAWEGIFSVKTASGIACGGGGFQVRGISGL